MNEWRDWVGWVGVWDFPDEDADTFVEVVLRGGEIMDGCVDEFIWTWHGNAMDIVRYIVVEETE